METTIKPKKSVALTEAEWQELKNMVSDIGADAVSFDLRVNRMTLERLLLVGSASEKTINTIRQNLPS